MSLAFLSKPIGGSKKDADSPEEPKEPKASRTPKLGPVRGGAGNIIVGGAPRVDLMPPEIRLKRSQLRTRRSLRLVLFGVFVVVLAGCIGTWAMGTVAQATLSAAQAQQQQLVLQQAKYSAVTTIKQSISLIEAGQKVGDSTEIDWQSYLTELQAKLPAGSTFSTVTVKSATPLVPLDQATSPLQGSRIATLTFTSTSPTLPSIPDLLNGLKTLPGFVDATPGNVTLETGVYTADVTMHINTEAFANRFDTAAAAANKKAMSTAAPTTGGN
jgi:hypothetical protein